MGRPIGTPEADLYSRILCRVGRSFALSLGILPRGLRAPVGLAYLLARAADTLADTALISQAERLRSLELFREEVRMHNPSRLEELLRACTGAQRIAEERELLERLPNCFAVLASLDPGDQGRVRAVLLTLTEGMVWDLQTFPQEDEGKLVALETREDLDRYTYYAAGCVGEFWTDIHLDHRKALRGWDRDLMTARGVRFGKGLQMTNILRDLPRDLRRGRCYLPRQDLAALGLEPADLLEPGAITKLRPLLHDLLARTLSHYDAGWAYTLAIPVREWRMRLACAWPLLIGLRTLALVARAQNLLDPSVKVKISRGAVYGILARSALLVWSNRALDAYSRQLRRGVLP